MGDGFFVCHHLAALYAYGYVLVRRRRRRRRRCASLFPPLL